MTARSESIESELTRRHRTTVTVVGGMFALAVLFIVLAYAGIRPAPSRAAPDPTLITALWITILIFGLGAVALRRTRFMAMRLQDIAALQGASGLLASLQKTTILVALIGGAIALMGFVVWTLTGDSFDMLRAGLVAVAVLLYCYPRRSAWQRVVEQTESIGGAAEDTPPVKGKTA